MSVVKSQVLLLTLACSLASVFALPPEIEAEKVDPAPGTSVFGETEDYRYKWKVDPTNNSTIRPGTEFFTPKFGHEQKREKVETSGRYYVYLPDGRLQITDYTSKPGEGFKATIRYIDQDVRNAETLRQEAIRAAGGNPAAASSQPQSQFAQPQFQPQQQQFQPQQLQFQPQQAQFQPQFQSQQPQRFFQNIPQQHQFQFDAPGFFGGPRFARRAGSPAAAGLVATPNYVHTPSHYNPRGYHNPYNRYYF
jgi:hypothetical protein